jgi:ATP-dependent helicase/nuclease subunit A
MTTTKSLPKWPIVAQMKPSEEQLPAVEARNRDVVVTAGAGAGKTRTLVARYLSLLADGMPLRSIIAITFTKKAAREMRNRVRDQMRRYLERSDLDSQERIRWQELYSELDAARIDTIHGLCTEILRSHPAEAGIDPRFQVIEEGQGRVLINQAIDDAMAWGADNDQVVTIFPLLGEKALRQALDQLMKRRLDAEKSFANLPVDVVAFWRDTLYKQKEELLDQLLASTEWRAAIQILENNRASDTSDLIEIQRRTALGIVTGATGSVSEQVERLAQLEQIKLTGGSGKFWSGGKAQVEEVKGALKALRGLWAEQPIALAGDWTTQDEQIANALRHLHSMFAFACSRYESAKRERQALDFDDLESGALALLRQDANVRARWQQEPQAILVDEFQDTNERQRDLMAFLNGASGKLFIVGDAKQSIYRFRGADVTVFRSERERIKQDQGAVLDLEISYRAHAGLLQNLNDLMRPVLGEEENPRRPWGEPFKELKHYREEPGSGIVSPYIELHLTVGSKKTGALGRAADAVVARLAQLVEIDHVQIEDEGELRSLGYGDIAILCRSSTSFGEYEDALERAGISSLTVSGRGFYGRPEVRDLLNALHAIADPSDDLALVGLMRSPVFALSDEALYRLVDGRKTNGKDISLWTWLQDKRSALPGDDARRATRAVDILRRLNSHVGRTSVADLLKNFLDQTDYRAALIQTGLTRGARNVDKLLDDAHRSGIVGVGEFLEYVATLRDTGTREGEARATAEGSVQIMSVHAAKGLEFPIVVIGDITYDPPKRNELLIDPKLGVLLPLKDEEKVLPTIYQLGKELADDQESAEFERLFYVAATRAREKLILNGCIGLTTKSSTKDVDGWLGLIAGDGVLNLKNQTIAYDAGGAKSIQLDLKIGDGPFSCVIYEPNVNWHTKSRDQQQATDMPALPPLLVPVTSKMERVDSRIIAREQATRQQVWRVVPTVERPRAPRWVIGSLVHEALATWSFPDRGNFEEWIKAHARSHGIADSQQLDDAVHECRRILTLFQNHPLYQEMNKADRRLPEVPYSYQEQDRPDNGIIDAVYLRNAIWTIVEFKTDKLKDEADLKRLLDEEDYLAQAGRYKVAVKQLLGQEPQLVLCLLDFDGSVRLETDLGV